MSKSTEYEICMSQVRGQMWPLAIFSLFVNLLMLVSSIYMMQVFDRVLTSGSIDTLSWLTAGALFAILIYVILEYARRQMLVRVGQWIEKTLFAPLVRRGMQARLGGQKSEAGPSDIADLKNFYSGESVLALLDAPWLPIFCAVIWLMHPMLGVVAVAGAILLFGLAVANDLMTRKGTGTAMAEAQATQTYAQQAINQAETISPLGMIGNMMARLQAFQAQAHRKMLAATGHTEVISNSIKGVRQALQILILGVGAFLVLKGELSSGGMIGASIILGRALSPVERALGAWKSFVSAQRARKNLTALFEGSERVPGEMRIAPQAGRLALEQASYQAVGANEPLLNRIDVRIEPGTTCGIIGPSGSGKSSLCRMIVGAWEPTSGHVRLDGADLSTWDPDTLGQHIGYLPQQIELFPGTIAENIARMGRFEPEQVAEAARLADVHEMILRLPKGYDTDVGQYGNKLSGGQRQRIGLARALFGKPLLIVLDEPNSNLDGAGNAALVRTLAELKRQGRTVVLVAHQPAALQTADNVLIIEGGAVSNFGPRDEILGMLLAKAPKVMPMVAQPRRSRIKATLETTGAA